MNELHPKNFFPVVPDDLSSIVKPEELVDIVEMTPLTLQDRRIYNLLIGNAWNNITVRSKHAIARQELTKYVDSNNQDIKASLRRLMAAIVVIKVRNNKNGQSATRQIQLMGTNEIEDNGGAVEYSFPEELIKIIKDTQIFARLHTKVMFELSSKYSLTLYEFLQKRKNLQYVNHEIMTVDEIRALMGIGKDKLKSFGHLNDKALKPAVREVSFLTEYEITAEPIRTGKAVTHIKFIWNKKTDIGAQIATVEELERAKLGRKERMNQTVESVQEITSSQKSDSSAFAKPIGDLLPKILGRKSTLLLSSSGIEGAKKAAQEMGKRIDVYALEQDFLEYANKSGFQPENADGAFIGFVRKKLAEV